MPGYNFIGRDSHTLTHDAKKHSLLRAPQNNSKEMKYIIYCFNKKMFRIAINPIISWEKTTRFNLVFKIRHL
jgi:hypothetical protein